MKKIKSLLIVLIGILIFPTIADAASVSVSVRCNDVTVGGTSTCTISGSSTALSAIDAKLSLEGPGSMESITPGAGFTSMDNTASGTSGSFVYLTAADKSGSFTIATVKVKGNSAGAVTLKVNSINVSTDNDSNNSTIGSAKGSFSVKAPTTAATTAPTTKPQTTKATTTAQTKPQTTTIATQTTTVITEALGVPLVLESVRVGDFEVTQTDGKYYATVNYDTEAVEVTATGDPRLTIVGQGNRNLAVGKNVAELVLTNEAGHSAIVQIIITRPEDTNDYDTSLASLKVVGYDIKFDKNTKEYTLNVDSTVKEIYVIATSNNKDVSITGAGLITLNKGKNEVHVLSQYGNKSKTEYVITIKRNYTTAIMGCSVAILVLALGGGTFYFMNDRKKLLAANKATVNKEIAEEKRNNIEAKPALSVNGESTLGTGKTTVAPTQVVATKVPTNPVTVAQSTVVPKPTEVNTINPENKPVQQVRVVKKAITPSQVKTINTVNTSNNYANDQIVINPGNSN